MVNQSVIDSSVDLEQLKDIEDLIPDMDKAPHINITSVASQDIFSRLASNTSTPFFFLDNH